MPDSVEFLGKNVEKAVKKACSKLKITPNEIKYDVLSFGSTGIFGLAGSKKAKIRVILEDNPEVIEAESGNDFEESHDNFEKSTFHQDVENGNEADTQDVPTDSNLDNSVALGRDILQRIADSLTSDATIEVKKNSERVLYDIVGGNSAILIGKRGQTLEAIQSIVEKAVNKSNKNRIRIQIDVAGYLETRWTNLEKLGNRLAEKAKRIGKPISLGQMSAADRRIIHLALKDDPAVRTQSRGDGYLKKLVIFPQKERKKNKH
jgi:spoIIIJ-associated protein